MEIELAGCVIPDSQGRILLIHRKIPTHDQWELPGGKVKEGETKAEAATRELFEELQVKVTIIRELGHVSFLENSKAFNYTWFLARINGGEPSIGEPVKFDAWQHTAIEELGDMRLSNNMRMLLPHLKRPNFLSETS